MRLMIYTNIMTPYRAFFYELLAEQAKTIGWELRVVLMARTEPNRNWYYEDYAKEYTVLLKSHLLKFRNIFVHYNPDLKQFLKEYKPNIVVCGGGYICPGVYQICKLKKKYNYLTVFWNESHLKESRNYSKAILGIRERLRRIVFSKFDGFWCPGILARELVEKYARKDAFFFRMPNIVDKEIYGKACNIDEKSKERIALEYNINLSKIIMICPARLSAEKGILEFITFFDRCSKKDACTIVIPGDGPLKEKIKAESENRKIDLRLLGFQNQNQLVQLYAISDLFLLPSLSDANPLTCIEAAWAALPLFVSSHVGNYPEIIETGVNGYVFDFNDAKTLSYFDTLPDKDDKWYLKAGQESRRIAEERFDPDLIIPSIFSFLKKQFEEKISVSCEK